MSNASRVFRHLVPFTILADGIEYGDPLHVRTVVNVRALPSPPPDAIMIGSLGEAVAGSYYWDELNTDIDDGDNRIAVTAFGATGRYVKIGGQGSGGGGGSMLSVADNAALRALATQPNLTACAVGTPGQTWIYFTSSGAGLADDDLTIVKPATVLVGNNGRWYPLDPGAIVPTFAAARLAVSGRQQILVVSNRASSGDGGGGIFVYDAADVTSSDDDATILLAGTKRYKRQWSGAVHCHWWGCKPNDTSFNNQIPYAAALNFASGKYTIDHDGGRYRFWDLTVPPTQAEQFRTSAINLPTKTTLRGIKGKTVFEFRAAGNTDPTNAATLPKLASTLSPLLRSTAYVVGNQRFVNGHSYICSQSGTTSANPADAPSGVFSGLSALDGTCLWSYSEIPYRGGCAVAIRDNVTDVEVTGITFDGLATWVDGLTPPPGIGAYVFSNPSTVYLQFNQAFYLQVTYALGWDVTHKCIWNGVIDGTTTGTGIDRIVFRDCDFRNWRGEIIYGDGIDNNSPHTALSLYRCHIEEGPVGISSSTGLVVERCTFKHLHMTVDTARGRSDFDFVDNLAEDCGHGLAGEQGLQTQATPGKTVIRDNSFRNFYGYAVYWNLSFSGLAGNRAVAALRVEHNDFFDCGWNTASCIQVGVGNGTFPLQGSLGTVIRHNNFHVGPLVGPARSGSPTATRIGNAMNITGQFNSLEISHNRMIIDDSAITAGHQFAAAMNWGVQPVASGSRDVWVHHNYFVSAGSGGIKLGPPYASSDQYFGRWHDNILWVDGQALPWVGGSDYRSPYVNGETVYPKMTEWYVASAADNTSATVTSLGRPNMWEYNQEIVIRNDLGNARPVIFPESSATHNFRALRLISSKVELVVRRTTSSLASDAPIWQEIAYRLIDSGLEPAADVIAPSFQTSNSELPKINMWGVHTIHLTPGAGTDINEVINPPDETEITVYFNANCRFRHNAGAGAIKLELHGDVDYLPAASGEIRFDVDGDLGIAIERLRIENGISTIGGDTVLARQVKADNATNRGTFTGNSLFWNFTGTPGLYPGGGATSFLLGDTGFQLNTTAKTSPSLWAWTNTQSTVLQNIWDISPDNGQARFTIRVTTVASGSVGMDLYCRAGNANGGNNSGGAFIAEGGNISGSPANLGGALLGLYRNATEGDRALVEVLELGGPSASRKIVALCMLGRLTTTQMPASSGDKVVYLANATTNPTASAVGGGILYATGGAATWRGSSGTVTTMGPA